MFVAISGLLAATLLIGWSMMISTQRYKDSVDTTYVFLQQQYNLVFNVENGRTNNFTCNNGVPQEITAGNTGGEPRGQTDCVLLGRYVQLDGGRNFTSWAVIGTEPTGLADNADAITTFKAYRPQVVRQNIGLSSDELEVPWQTAIKGTKDAVGGTGERDTLLNRSILILRSPEDGTVHTYTARGSNVAIAADNPQADSLLQPSKENQDVTLCFDAGIAIRGSRQAVEIKKFASSQNAVVLLGDSDKC